MVARHGPLELWAKGRPNKSGRILRSTGPLVEWQIQTRVVADRPRPDSLPGHGRTAWEIASLVPGIKRESHRDAVAWGHLGGT